MQGTVAVFGLGTMGAGMAHTLVRGGWNVVGVDPSPSAADRMDGALRLVDTATAIRDAQVLLLSLPGTPQVEEVLTGPTGLVAAGVDHGVVIDTSTSSPLSTRALARTLANHGHSLLDAPVSGGGAGAREGALTVFLGGTDDAVAEGKALLDVIAQRVVHVGGPSAGNVAKLINNLLCATHLQIAGEALTLAQAADLDAERLLSAVNGASGRSAVTEVNLPRWVLPPRFDSGFTLGLMARDVALATDTAHALGAHIPLADLVTRTWQDTRDHIGAGEDFNRMAQP
jgi:3-hydroxyisobutyrate dehydrogenase